MNSMNSVNPIISNAIDCPNMDCKNIANLIESFTTLSPLQNAYKRFCEEKSLYNHSEYNDNYILQNIISDTGIENLFRTSFYKLIFVQVYCDKKCKEDILQFLLDSFDFQYFNASLIMSLYDDHDYCCIDNEMCEAEQSIDGYNGSESEEDYCIAMKHSSILKLISICLEDSKLSIIKQYIDPVYEKHKDNLLINKEVYERIWNRAFDLQDEIYSHDGEDSEEDEYEENEEEYQ